MIRGEDSWLIPTVRHYKGEEAVHIPPQTRFSALEAITTHQQVNLTLIARTSPRTV